MVKKIEGKAKSISTYCRKVKKMKRMLENTLENNFKTETG